MKSSFRWYGESDPVTEEIKLGLPEGDRHIENYCENIRRCAKYGIKCITYNFMPVFDWTRTRLDKEAPDGYFRPDHGRMIWGETGKPGYGLYDRALGSAYINGLIEANGGKLELL